MKIFSNNTHSTGIAYIINALMFFYDAIWDLKRVPPASDKASDNLFRATLCIQKAVELLGGKDGVEALEVASAGWRLKHGGKQTTEGK